MPVTQSSKGLRNAEGGLLFANPPAITFKGIKGPNEGKTILAIYELSGNALRICYDLTGQQRPTTFTTGTEPAQLLVRYKKEPSKQ